MPILHPLRITVLFAGFACAAALLLPAAAQSQSPDYAAQRFGQAWPATDFSRAAIDLREIVSGGPPRDGIPAIDTPRFAPAARADHLAPNEPVIALHLEGQARAYPLQVLMWHEIANDTVGGLHVAVTYCPLCHSALVFDRDIGGEVREFGVSGLLYNSNVLMYDRQESEAEESLWSQMLFTAACGPAAEEGLELRLLPSEFTTWRAWHEAHPETDVLSFETGYPRNYDRNPYEQYFAVDELMFPVKSVGEAAPDFDSVPPKENTIVLQSGSALKGYAVSRLMEAVGEDGVVEDEFGGTVYRFELVDERGPSFRVTTDDGELAPAAYTFWFEFRAMHPTAEVFAAI